MKKLIVSLVVFLTIFSVVGLPAIANAQISGNVGGGTGLGYIGGTGLGTADLKDTIVGVLNIALGFLGIVAVIIILMGGFKYMTAGGDTAKVDKAKQLIYAGIIGLVIILAAYAVATFVISNILKQTGGGTVS
jgi:hypothetical protein